MLARTHAYALPNMAGVITVIELAVLYSTSVYAAALMTRAAGLRLDPPNPERSFVAASILRASLELGHPQV